MGIQEQESRQRTQRHQLQTLILQTVQLAGILGVAIVAPNVLGAMLHCADILSFLHGPETF